jgi:hypothetical protein
MIDNRVGGGEEVFKVNDKDKNVSCSIATAV